MPDSGEKKGVCRERLGCRYGPYLQLTVYIGSDSVDITRVVNEEWKAWVLGAIDGQCLTVVGLVT